MKKQQQLRLPLVYPDEPELDLDVAALGKLICESEEVSPMMIRVGRETVMGLGVKHRGIDFISLLLPVSIKGDTGIFLPMFDVTFRLPVTSSTRILPVTGELMRSYTQYFISNAYIMPEAIRSALRNASSWVRKLSSKVPCL